MYNIPSIQCFRVFETVNRLKSFTKAADELGISQGAVSQHIKTLEVRVGFEVFSREGRTIKITDSGRALLDSADSGLRMIANTIAMEKRKQQSHKLTISIQPGFAVRWLFPRLKDFNDEHPNMQISVNSIASPVDFNLFHAHAGLDYGCETPEQKSFLFREHLFPVCSPEFAREHNLIENGSVAQFARQLPGLELLGDEGLTPLSFQYTWPYWAQKMDVDLPSGIISRYNQSNITLQLAELGHGIALGRTSLVLDALTQGRLIALTNVKVLNPCGYYLVHNPALPMTDSINRFEAWLTENTKQIERYADIT